MPYLGRPPKGRCPFFVHCIQILLTSYASLLMNGTNGSQVWDAAFTIQAMVESGLAEEPEFKDSLLKAMDFLDVSQVRSFESTIYIELFIFCLNQHAHITSDQNRPCH